MTKKVTKNKEGLVLTVDVTNTETFKDIFNILQDMLTDKRIDAGLRVEYTSRVKKLIGRRFLSR